MYSFLSAGLTSGSHFLPTYVAFISASHASDGWHSVMLTVNVTGNLYYPYVTPYSDDNMDVGLFR